LSQAKGNLNSINQSSLQITQRISRRCILRLQEEGRKLCGVVGLAFGGAMNPDEHLMWVSFEIVAGDGALGLLLALAPAHCSEAQRGATGGRPAAAPERLVQDLIACLTIAMGS
jgi:hypothetical protein